MLEARSDADAAMAARFQQEEDAAQAAAAQAPGVAFSASRNSIVPTGLLLSSVKEDAIPIHSVLLKSQLARSSPLSAVLPNSLHEACCSDR